jgi:hypothetical protein
MEWIHGIDTYKYLCVLQPRQIQHITIKKPLTTAQTSRQQTILKTHFKSKNLTKAISVCIIPSSTYSFGITSWSQTDLEFWGTDLYLRSPQTPPTLKKKVVEYRRPSGLAPIHATILPNYANAGHHQESHLS